MRARMYADPRSDIYHKPYIPQKSFSYLPDTKKLMLHSCICARIKNRKKGNLREKSPS